MHTLFLEDDLVLLTKSVIKWFMRRVTNDEMLRIYYIPVSNDNYVINAQSEILYDLLPFRRCPTQDVYFYLILCYIVKTIPTF